MKTLLQKIGKHASHVTKHVSKHKHKYAFSIFGSFAIVKMVLLFAGFFGLMHVSNTFAQVDGELNSSNITDYCATSDTSCSFSSLGITSIAPDTFINHTSLQYLDL
jgi:hypothetical protein